MANNQDVQSLFLSRLRIEFKPFAPSKLTNMKASPFSFLISLSLLVALSLPGFSQSGQYTVQIDSMVNQDAAEAKVAQLKSQGLNAYWLKSSVPGQGLRFRVRIERFSSRAAAVSYGTRLKQQGIFPDFYAALWEGNTSPFGNIAEAKPKPVVPAPVKVATPKPVVAEPQQAQRVRETTKPLANISTDKPQVNSPSADNTLKPSIKVQATPTPSVPAQNAAPKSVPTIETKPLKASPWPIPPMEVKPPRDKKASNDAPSGTNVTTSVGKVAKETVAAATTPVPAVSVGFIKFEDKGFGYSFEHPNYWSGGNIEQSQLQAQRIDSGAIFRSQQDAAFTHAIWNSLKNANSPAYDNNLIVDLVIKSVGNSAGMQGLTETARRMSQDGDQIKTFVDLRTMFQQTRATTPLEFQGKAVIIRSSAGILLVVAFFSKDSAPMMSASAERIISSASVPQ